MDPFQTYLSLAINTLVVLIVGYVLVVLYKATPDKHLSSVSRHYLLQRRYELLRASLLFVLLAVLARFILLLYGTFSGAGVDSSGLLISDLAFVGMVIVLSKMYEVHQRIAKKGHV